MTGDFYGFFTSVDNLLCMSVLDIQKLIILRLNILHHSPLSTFFINIFRKSQLLVKIKKLVKIMLRDIL